MTVKTTPKIGIIPGDPSGIGPELVAKLLAAPDVRARADILLIGDRHVFELGQQQTGKPFVMQEVSRDEDTPPSVFAPDDGFALHALHTIQPSEVSIATHSKASGQSTLRCLDRALDLIKNKAIDALVFAPLNKTSMHLAGIGHADELHYMAEKLEVRGYISELNTLDAMWTSRVTSHIALKDVADAITGARIERASFLIDQTLRRAGYENPRVAVAGLNPHAGDGGNFGTEEIEIIAPAVRAMADKGMTVTGPWPSDTVFLKAIAGEIDAVVTMYHDQGQIALKLLGFDRGVTVQGGLPVPVTTPAHGTAFDISGQNRAEVGAMKAAFVMAHRMVTHWNKDSEL
ncbi:MAG: 4-hydroxythreonine-4-phosphate dehydrogenase PdxA [Pseudomonadota bacterium]